MSPRKKTTDKFLSVDPIAQSVSKLSATCNVLFSAHSNTWSFDQNQYNESRSKIGADCNNAFAVKLARFIFFTCLVAHKCPQQIAAFCCTAHTLCHDLTTHTDCKRCTRSDCNRNCRLPTAQRGSSQSAALRVLGAARHHSAAPRQLASAGTVLEKAEHPCHTGSRVALSLPQTHVCQTRPKTDCSIRRRPIAKLVFENRAAARRRS